MTRRLLTIVVLAVCLVAPARSASADDDTYEGRGIVSVESGELVVNGAVVDPDDPFGSEPQWSTDGTKLVYAGLDGIRTVFGIGLGVQHVTDDSLDRQPTWSPDGAQVAFTRTVSVPGQSGSGSDIFRIDADGTGLTRLTTSGHASSPAWSPGGEIAFFDDTASTGGLFVMGADGGGARRIAGGAEKYDALDWSPDGARLAFAGGDGIHTIAADGSGDLRISKVGVDSSPSWSPSGRHLVYSTYDPDVGAEQVVVGSDGSDPDTQLLSRARLQPDWGPRVPPSLIVFHRPDAAPFHQRGNDYVVYGYDAKPEDVPVADAAGRLAGEVVYRPSTSTFFRPDEELGSVRDFQYGRRGDVPVAASPYALFRPSNGTWYGPQQTPVAYGRSGDRPVAADWDGRGSDDIAVFRPSNGTWYVRGQSPVAFGRSTDVPVPTDYRGTGRAEIAVFRPSDGTWYVRGAAPVPFGRAGDIPLPGDYLGDGSTQLAVYRPSNHTFYVRGLGSAVYGGKGDIPVPGYL